MFSTISSISPRVFINAPMERLSFQLLPVKRAAIMLPPNLPSTATATTAPADLTKGAPRSTGPRVCASR